MTAKLSVNLNAVAMLRNRRDLPWPSVTGLGRIALDAGAHGLTVHPRPDERHIRRSDVPELAKLIALFPDREFNIEGNPEARFIELVESVRPTQVTLVPDTNDQATSDHGWDIEANAPFLRGVVSRLKEFGCRVSLFVDPDPYAPPLARDVGADRVEVYTGPYGSAFEPEAHKRELAKIEATGRTAQSSGLGLNAGHDLTLDNLPPLVAVVPSLAEVSIGHALTADALTYGMAETVRRYREACGETV